MDLSTFQHLTCSYPKLRVAVLGDFCLDRYLEIDPARQETSIETGLPVHNVVNVRPQPGGAGTILNNLCALGVGAIFPIGFVGCDGEGFELWRELERRSGVRLDYYVRSEERRTFTYCKPLVVAAGHPPVELNRLDTKNWTPTPKALEEALICHLQAAARSVDAVIVLDQVDTPETGVVTSALLRALRQATQENPQLLVLADSRRGLRGYPPVIFKMNAAELGVLTGKPTSVALNEIQAAALALASANRQRVFVTLSERGLLGASPEGQTVHVPALPLRGPIDVVGAGDAVTANLTAALAAGASLAQAVEIANAAASIVVHKLGTTGTANLTELAEILAASAR